MHKTNLWRGPACGGVAAVNGPPTRNTDQRGPWHQSQPQPWTWFPEIAP